RAESPTSRRGPYSAARSEESNIDKRTRARMKGNSSSKLFPPTGLFLATNEEFTIAPFANSEYFVPRRSVLEHHFAQQPDRRRAVPEQFVVKFFQRKSGALLLLIITAQLEDLQFADGIIEILRIERPAQRLLIRRLVFVVTVFLEKLRGVLQRHPFAVRFDGDTQAAE